MTMASRMWKEEAKLPYQSDVTLTKIIPDSMDGWTEPVKAKYKELVDYEQAHKDKLIALMDEYDNASNTNQKKLISIKLKELIQKHGDYVKLTKFDINRLYMQECSAKVEASFSAVDDKKEQAYPLLDTGSFFYRFSKDESIPMTADEYTSLTFPKFTKEMLVFNNDFFICRPPLRNEKANIRGVQFTLSGFAFLICTEKTAVYGKTDEECIRNKCQMTPRGWELGFELHDHYRCSQSSNYSVQPGVQFSMILEKDSTSDALLVKSTVSPENNFVLCTIKDPVEKARLVINIYFNSIPIHREINHTPVDLAGWTFKFSQLITCRLNPGPATIWELLRDEPATLILNIDLHCSDVVIKSKPQTKKNLMDVLKGQVNYILKVIEYNKNVEKNKKISIEEDDDFDYQSYFEDIYGWDYLVI